MATRKRLTIHPRSTDTFVPAKSRYFPAAGLNPRSPERILDYDQEPAPVTPPPDERTLQPAALSNGSSGGILFACLILAYLSRRNGGGR